MRDERDAPIEEVIKDRKKYYFYSNLSYSFWNIHLNEEQLNLLAESVSLLKQIRGFSLADQIGEIVAMIESRLKHSTEGIRPLISFEDTPIAAGTEYLEDLYKMIQQKRVLHFTYRSYSSEKDQVLTIHPYFLKEYNNRWYLIGWIPQTKRIENRALDRISKLSVTGKAFREPVDFDPDSYFADIVGVTRYKNKPLEKVDLKVNYERAPYVLTKPMHQSQSIERQYKDGSIQFSIQVIINQELKNLILSFGDKIEVKAPLHLRIEIQKMFSDAAKIYEIV